jgi:DNA-binding response OmpR family regulator
MIMVVDDEPEIRKLLEMIITGAGHVVVTVSNGKKALNLLNSVMFDLMILDMLFPDDIDGYEVCRRIRGNSLQKSLPIMIISGMTDPKDELKAFNAGADEYVTKPFDNNELLARIRALLERSRKTK